MHKTMGVQSLEKFITDATAVGVTAASLKPFTDVLARSAEFHAVMEQVDKLDPVGDAIANGGDLAAALEAEAKNEAIYARAEAHADHQQATARTTASTIMEDPAVADAILHDLAATLAPAAAAIDKIIHRWGDENPDPAQVAATATAAEIKDYRSRTEHITTRNRIRTLLNTFLVEAPSSTGTAFHKFPVLRVPTRLRLYREPWMWIIRDDNTFLTTQQARAHLNAQQSNIERRDYLNRRTSPRPPFHATYTVAPDALDTATFNADGTPTADTPLMTNKDYERLFGPEGGTGNTSEQRTYLDALEAIRSSR